MNTRRCLTALALAALSGCGGGIGELCSVDQDCRSGLRCSGVDGKRGVCIYASAPAADRGLADRPPPDLMLHDLPVRPERAPGDEGAKDAPVDRAPLDAAPYP